MPSSRAISRTEQRIAEIDALRQMIEQLKQDLQNYGDALRRELDALHLEVENDDAAAAAHAPLPKTDPDLFPAAAEEAEGEPVAPLASPFELEDSEKRGGKPVSVLISDGTISEEPLSGWVIDRPPGGLKILVDDEIQLGRVIGVRPTREHPDAQWINVCVKAVHPERQSYVLTCTFVARPPWTALQLFNG